MVRIKASDYIYCLLRNSINIHCEFIYYLKIWSYIIAHVNVRYKINNVILVIV